MMRPSLARRAVTLAVVLVVLVAVDLALHRSRRQWDLTAERSLTLSSQTEQVIDELDRRVRITAFVRRSDPARVPTASLLSQYRRAERRITFRILDPDDAPAEAQRLGIDPVYGGVVVESGGERQVAGTPSEQDVTAALARLVRDVDASVCVTTGHGERDVDDTTAQGLSSMRSLLADNGYRVREADLLREPEPPAGCDALVLASPAAPLGPAGEAIGRWLDRGGRALVLADPGSRVDLSPVTSPYGMVLEKGLVLEGDPQRRFPEDPFRPIVDEYRSASPIVRRLPPTFFPGVQGVLAEDGTRGGLTVTSLARTSTTSYLERRPSEPRFDPAEDLAGPVVVAAAADRSENRGGRVLRTRVVVVGDADFASNAAVGEAGNGALVVRAVDWLTLQEDLVSVDTNIAALRPLALTEGRISYARLLAAGIVPALFLVLGALGWALRRSR